jgi:hypothetical protein
MNNRQKEVLASWPMLLWNFTKREWLSVFLSASAGVVVAQFVHLAWLDRAFESSFVGHYKPTWILSDNPRYYVPYAGVFGLFVLIALAPRLYPRVWRGLRSWLNGVTSGLVFLPFASSLVITLLPEPAALRRLLLGSILAVAWFSVGFYRHLRANLTAARTIGEEEFMVSSAVRSQAGSQLEWSDDPIQTWAQDAMGRAALVDSLSAKIMIAKAPVILLSGSFGSGKTSTLNLLREHLADKTIAVLFSTWLPGSQETLTSYLLRDIATECGKQYLVPGLRTSAVRLATALGEKVPVLGEYLKLLPPATQREDIANMKLALQRLPKRVMVLLDEIDRMEEEEITTLLKMIRGFATLPNLSFVCAGNLDELIKITGKNHEYFEKFFPIVISVPDPNPAAIRKATVDRIVTAFANSDWFDSKAEAEQLKNRLDAAWAGKIAPFCKTLRASGLLANNVSVASASLRREVDPLDLTLLEMLHRFIPAVYQLLSKSSLVLTGGESLDRGGGLEDEKSLAENRTTLLKDIADLSGEQSASVRSVVDELFPLVSSIERRFKRARSSSKQLTVEADDKRIKNPGIFPAYFRYELPDEMFNSTQITALMRQLERAPNQEDCDKDFLAVLQSMEKGSLKRDDFLRKLTYAAKVMPIVVATRLGQAAAKAAENYTYDLMSPFAEAGHALRIILFTALRLSSHTERVSFLRDCIFRSSDDTMAFRILTELPRQRDDSAIDVTIGELYGSFADRMRRRYGRDVDATNFDLSTSDSWALEYWGRDLRSQGIPSVPEDKKIQNEFWLRYIGNSSSRLARAFREFFLPLAAYSEDPAPLVENRISLKDLTRLYNELPESPDLTDKDRKSLNSLGRFLNGEFKNGINPLGDIW